MCFFQVIWFAFDFISDGRTDPILDDVSEAFQLMGVNLHELEDYIHNIEPVTFPHQIPSFPVSKNNVLQFPQPGSKDAEERKDYIPDYLPPIVSSQEGLCPLILLYYWPLWWSFRLFNFLYSTNRNILEMQSQCFKVIYKLF